MKVTIDAMASMPLSTSEPSMATDPVIAQMTSLAQVSMAATHTLAIAARWLRRLGSALIVRPIQPRPPGVAPLGRVIIAVRAAATFPGRPSASSALAIDLLGRTDGGRSPRARPR